MKTYIKKFNSEAEYKCWVNIEKGIQETEVGTISTDDYNWFTTDKDLYIPISEDWNGNDYLVITVNNDNKSSLKWPLFCFDQYENCIIIPLSLINCARLAYTNSTDTEIDIYIDNDRDM